MFDLTEMFYCLDSFSHSQHHASPGHEKCLRSPGTRLVALIKSNPLKCYHKLKANC